MSTFTTLPPLALYVHVPWCVRKCPYCDFNSHEANQGIPEKAYVDALLRDLEHDLPRVGGRRAQSVFIGGGTPSLFAPGAIEALLAGVRARIPIAPDAEITLEANPGTVDADRFAGFRAAGVNRLSLGIQSFCDAKLQALGRIHGANEALQAAEAARRAGFDNLNLDLMFGLPGQSVDEACEDAMRAIALQPAHLSLYQLTLEPGTPFYHRPPALPDDDAIWSMQIELQALLEQAGYGQYEVSAYAQPGRQCRHNRNYWLYGDYLGIGAGAHGKITEAGGVTRLWKRKQPKDYLEKAGTAEALGGEQRLAPEDLPLEFMMNTLRLPEGFESVLFVQRTGLPLSVVAEPLAAATRRALLEREDSRIRPTALGMRYLNDLLALFLPTDRTTAGSPASTASRA